MKLSEYGWTNQMNGIIHQSKWKVDISKWTLQLYIGIAITGESMNDLGFLSNSSTQRNHACILGESENIFNGSVT